MQWKPSSPFHFLVSTIKLYLAKMKKKVCYVTQMSSIEYQASGIFGSKKLSFHLVNDLLLDDRTFLSKRKCFVTLNYPFHFTYSFLFKPVWFVKTYRRMSLFFPFCRRYLNAISAFGMGTGIWFYGYFPFPLD